MEPLKEMFNKKFYEHFAVEFKKEYKVFDEKSFITNVTRNLDYLSLNERMRNTSFILKKYLPVDYSKTIQIMKQVIPNINGNYTTLVFSDYVGLFGQKDFNVSMDALKYFTPYGSSEFAIRTFLRNNFSQTIKVMYGWAKDKNYHVRRLASEGSRPRLPWSFKLDKVIENPKLTLPILESLKEDNEMYVKKSVANHINDISKDHPEYIIKLIKKWKSNNVHTNWIIKHGSRTLIKSGNKQLLNTLDYTKNVKVGIRNFNLNKNKVKLGETLFFQFDIFSKDKKRQKLVVDYIVHYKKKSGGLSPKVFKLKEIDLKPKEILNLRKNQLIKDFSTRKHFVGKHLLEIQINGIVLAKEKFEII